MSWIVIATKGQLSPLWNGKKEEKEERKQRKAKKLETCERKESVICKGEKEHSREGGQEREMLPKDREN